MLFDDSLEHSVKWHVFKDGRMVYICHKDPSRGRSANS